MEREGPLIAWPLCWMPGAGLTEEEAMIATKHRLPGERLSQGEAEGVRAGAAGTVTTRMLARSIRTGWVKT